MIEALELLKKYKDSKQRFFSAEDDVPIEGVLKNDRQELVTETDAKGNKRINRINYEIYVLQALRERLRGKEIWVVGADRYRNPEEDLPADFEQHRDAYYQALKLPTAVDDFITPLQQAMKEALQMFNDGLPNNPKVKIRKKGKNRIRLSPLEKQPEPVNIGRLKTPHKNPDKTGQAWTNRPRMSTSFEYIGTNLGRFVQACPVWSGFL